MSSFREVDGFVSMKMSDYINYLRKISEANNTEDPNFSFVTFDNSEISINVHNTKLYLVDFDMVKHLPRCHDNFLDTFKLASLLPGGEYCMMNAVSTAIEISSASNGPLFFLFFSSIEIVIGFFIFR